MQINNSTSNRARTYKSGSASKKTYSEQVGSHADIDKLEQANERLSNLLQYQATAAERTKIIDNASDFELPGITNKWATPAERALQLKKQQKELSRVIARNAKRNGRGRRVVSIDLKGNKVVVNDHSETDYEDDSELDDLPEQPKVEDREKTQWNADLAREGFIVPHYDNIDNTDNEQATYPVSGALKVLGSYLAKEGAVQEEVDFIDSDQDIDNGLPVISKQVSATERRQLRMNDIATFFAAEDEVSYDKKKQKRERPHSKKYHTERNMKGK